MATKAKGTRQTRTLEMVLQELRRTNHHLRKLLLLIPEESIRDYRNAAQIKRAYRKALKAFPPR